MVRPLKSKLNLHGVPKGTAFGLLLFINFLTSERIKSLLTFQSSLNEKYTFPTIYNCLLSTSSHEDTLTNKIRNPKYEIRTPANIRYKLNHLNI